MAHMFCSLKEAADRLKRTEEELKEIVKQGKLRGFPDGSKLLLKVDEVEALVLEEGIEAVPKALEAEAPAPPALETPALEAPEVGTPNPEVKEIEVPGATTPTGKAPEAQPSELEMPELETPELQTSDLDATDLEIPELEVPELEVAEPEPSALDMEELGILDLDEKMLVPQAGEPETPPAETPTATAPRPEEVAAAQPRIVLKPRFTAKPRIERTGSLRGLSVWQWLLKGLRQDNAVAVVVFGLLLCFILSAFAVLAYVLYAIF